MGICIRMDKELVKKEATVGCAAKECIRSQSSEQDGSLSISPRTARLKSSLMTVTQ